MYLGTYGSTGNSHLHLALSSTHQSRELLANALQYAQAVVCCQCLEEILDRVGLVNSSCVLLQFLDYLGLIAGTQSWRIKNFGEFGILFEDLGKTGQSFRSAFQGRLFGSGSVLKTVSICAVN